MLGVCVQYNSGVGVKVMAHTIRDAVGITGVGGWNPLPIHCEGLSVLFPVLLCCKALPIPVLMLNGL